MPKVLDFLDMSDDEFDAQMPASGDVPVVKEEPVKEAVVVEEVSDTKEPVEGEQVAVKEPEVDETDTEEAPKEPVVKPDANADEDAEPAESLEEEVVETAPDYETFYKQIMTPFKANGRTVELKTPEEAIQLMQMGANYTRKMQELAPQRKLLTMLQTNGLDEGKLSYLIDLDKKNPEAIKKLIKDAGIDPMEIDTSVEPAYREGNHRVSDEAVSFNQILEDLKSTPEGNGTIKAISDDWDQVSKEALWKNPEIMTTIHTQRSNGVYDRIAEEVNRQRVLGLIPGTIPFLQAYHRVGEEMTKANAFADLVAKTPVLKGKSAPAVVATLVATPKPVVKNSDRAAAASTSRSVSQKAKAPVVNPLEQSDDEFMKQFEGRL